MKIEDHHNSYEEHRETINWAIDRGLRKSQRIIGMHASQAIVELLSEFLHKINVIEMGFQINHRWFKSKRVFERFPDFPEKEIIIKKINKLELLSENLIYGSQKNEEEAKLILNLFNDIEKILLNLMEKEDESKQKK